MGENSLKKFSRLPVDIKETLSSPAFLGVVEKMEKRYKLKLTLIFIKLIVGDLSLSSLNSHLIREAGADSQSAAAVANQLASLLDKFFEKYPAQRKSKASQSPQISSEDKAEFNFFTEDGQEVKRFEDAAAAPVPLVDYQKLAERIIQDFGFGSQEENIKKRLINIVVARLKGVRDDLETREVLEKSVKIGGLDFPDLDSDRLLKLIKRANKDISLTNNLPTKKDNASRSVNDKMADYHKVSRRKSDVGLKDREADYVHPAPSAVATKPESTSATKDLAVKAGGLVNKPKIKMENGLPVIELPDDLMVKPQAIKMEKSVDKEQSVSPKNDDVSKDSEEQAASKPVKEMPTQETFKPAPFPSPNFGKKPKPKINPRLQSSRKPSLDDVKFSAKLIGPVEELQNMTLIDFRRLGRSPVERVEKIKEKIDLLEKDSYYKRIEGVNAWHKNEINRFYRLLGQVSMKEGRTIEQVIDERVKAQKPTLSIDEFYAVMDLNRQIRF